MTEFLISIVYFLVFCFIISRTKYFKDTIIPRHWFILLFSLKVVISIILTAIYTHYYKDRETADIFKYFDDSKIMFDALGNNPIDYIKMLFGLDNDNIYFTTKYYKNMGHWIRPYGNELFSDSHVIIRFNAFVRLFSFGFIQVHNIFINFITLSGLTAIYKAFKPYLVNKEKALFYSIALLPSLLFWGSGLLKEGLILFGFGFLTLHFFRIHKQFNFISILAIIVSCLIITYTKFYLLAALIIPLFGYTINKLLKKKSYVGYLISGLTILIITYILQHVNPNWNIVNIIANKQQTFSRFIIEVETNSGFLLPELNNTISIIKNIPNALNNTLIRPYPWECKSPFVWLSLSENILILSLILIAFLFRKRNNNNYNIIYFSLIFSISLIILIGLTTPVFGAIVRYKIPAVLFLLIGLITILDIEKLKSKFTWLNKIL
ncbi:MAG: hypothetical protein P1U41_02980 [Vicingaceae bacterium]|nr:hypothetical protein [Vicingaceae bacterium]